MCVNPARFSKLWLNGSKQIGFGSSSRTWRRQLTDPFISPAQLLREVVVSECLAAVVADGTRRLSHRRTKAAGSAGKQCMAAHWRSAELLIAVH